MSDSAREKPKRLRAVRRSVFWWTVSRFAVLMFSKLWFRIRCEGVESLPENGSVLLVANHASYLDPGMVGITATRWVGFLAQAGLASLAPCRWWLAQVGVTLIDRNAPSKESMRLVADCLKAGDVVGIFPEGTRSEDGSVHEFKGGVEFLVRRTKTTVVPIGIDGSHRALPRGSWFPRPRKIVVRYGEPWTAEQVLAPGGVEALRRKVAELARCPLAESSTAEVLPENRENVPGSAALPANSTGLTGAQLTGAKVAGGNATEQLGKGSAAGLVDPSSTSSSSASAGGGA